MEMKDVLFEMINENLVDENSEYFKKYVDIISIKYSEDTLLDKHHIVPRCVFKYKNVKVDNSKNNICYLPVDKHILAHYYLYKCSKQDWFEYANLLSILFFTGRKDITEQELIEILPDLVMLTEKAREYNSLCHSGENHVNYGKHLSEETKQRISKAKKGIYGSNGRVGTHLSDETKKKISQALIGKNCGKHHSDETKQKMRERHLGRKYKPMSEEGKKNISLSQHNMRWVVNEAGIKRVNVSELDYYLSQGYVRGKTIK